MLICVKKSNGELIEAQSDATDGTLIRNALAAGYSEADIEERRISAAEWAGMCLDLFDKTQTTSSKRAAALRALDDARLEAAMSDPLAPQAVKDYAAAMMAEK